MSDREAQFRVSLDGKDELRNYFRTNEADANRFANNLGNTFQRAGDRIRDHVSGIGRSLMMIGGIGAGVGIAEQANGVFRLRDALAGLKATANLTDDQLEQYRMRIHEVSRDANQLGEDVTGALQAFKDKGGSIEEGAQNLALYGRVATATGNAMADVARAGADMSKLGVSQQAGFGIFARQRDLLQVAPRLLSSFESGGVHGEAGLSRAVAFSQSVRSVLGDPEATRNAVEMAFQNVGEKSEQLQAEGIHVFDPKTGEARNRVDVITDIIRKAKGRQDILGRIFGGRVLRGLNPLAAEFRETGGFASLDRFEQQGGGSEVIDSMFQARRNTGLAQLKATRIAIEQSSDRNYGDTLDKVASHSGLFAEAYDQVTAHPILAGLGFMGARRALGGGLDVAQRYLFGGRGGGAAAIAGELGGAAGTGSPVFVTNWPAGGGLLGGAGGALGAAEKTGEVIAEKAGLGLLPRLLTSIGGGGVVAGAAVGITASLAALAAATAPLTQAMPKLIEDFKKLDKHADQTMAENAARDARNQVATGVRTIGTYGGKITPEQAALALKQGVGSYGESAADVRDEYERQQKTLRLFASGERAGVPEEEISKGVDGGAFLFRALRATSPEFAGAKTGKERAAILERLANSNEKRANELAKSFTAEPTMSIPNTTPYGPVQESVVDRTQSSLEDLGRILRDSLNLNFTLNIDQQSATVQSESGTRAPKVQVRRTAGGGG